jgi:Arc/MetJ family transcription regulator
MKTTIEIADPLFEEAKRLAAARNTTLKALVESALRQLVAQSRDEPPPFRLQSVTFDGDGLLPEIEQGGWERIRDVIYQGRGT